MSSLRRPDLAQGTEKTWLFLCRKAGAFDNRLAGGVGAPRLREHRARTATGLPQPPSPIPAASARWTSRGPQPRQG